MNQTVDVIALIAGVFYASVGVWLVADAFGTRLPFTVVVPVVGILAVGVALVASQRTSTSRAR